MARTKWIQRDSGIPGVKAEQFDGGRRIWKADASSTSRGGPSGKKRGW